MKINFDILLAKHNLSKAKFARELVSKGIFTSEVSALNAMAYHSKGVAKSVDFLLLQFLCDRFKMTAEEIIEK